MTDPTTEPMTEIRDSRSARIISGRSTDPDTRLRLLRQLRRRASYRHLPRLLCPAG
jgi:hypothetical protein